jgi:hypothetical protein
MRQRGLLLGLIVAGASFAMEAPTASSHEMERFPVRLAAFLPRSPLPLDFKPTSDEHYTGYRSLPGTCHGRCEGEEFCRTLVASDGKRYCGCSTNPP